MRRYKNSIHGTWKMIPGTSGLRFKAGMLPEQSAVELFTYVYQ